MIAESIGENPRLDVVGYTVAKQILPIPLRGGNAAFAIESDRAAFQIDSSPGKGMGAVGKIGEIGTRQADVGERSPKARRYSSG